jgi:phage regulator Rha-like protein
MSNLNVTTQNNTLVVDSRLIAEDLGIEHRALMQTVKKYLERLERKTPVTFKMEVVKRPQGGTYEVSHCFLNESQATLLMTFSRNSDQVLDCKERLVEAFSLAKNGHAQSPIALPQTYAQALLEAGRLAMENERLEAEKALLEQENSQLSEALDELFDYSSIVRIAKFNKVHESNFSWRPLKAMSIEMGLEIKKVPDARYETKNIYSHDVWRVVYPNAKLPETTTLVIKR